MMQSTMQDFPLNVGMIFRHGRAVHGESEVVTFEGDASRHASFAEVSARVDRLAAALGELGIESGDRVGTFMWNTQEHLEAYFAVPLHRRGAAHAQHPLVPRAAHLHREPRRRPARARRRQPGAGARARGRRAEDGRALRRRRRRRLRRRSRPPLPAPSSSATRSSSTAPTSTGFEYPEVDERAAAAMCYTSGTTGNPKGVVYSHRSTFLHTIGIQTGTGVPYTWNDRVLPIVPMFHANAWGMPVRGVDGRRRSADAGALPAGRAARHVHRHRAAHAPRARCPPSGPTSSATRRATTSTSRRLERIMCGGAAVPRALMEAFQERFGIRMLQAWGMTETSPLAAVSIPPRGVEPGTPEEMDWRSLTGRVAARCRAAHRRRRRRRCCRGTARRSARSRCAARGSPRPTTAIPRPRSSTTGGCAPATSPASHPTATSRSATARRTSSSRAGSGSRRWSSKAI